MEGAPDELGASGIDHRLFGVPLGLADFARATSVEEKARGDHVGEVEPGGGHGDETVEGDVGADIDQVEEAADCAGQEDSVGWNCSTGGYLWFSFSRLLG